MSRSASRTIRVAAARLAATTLATVAVLAQEGPRRRAFSWETRVTKTAETYGVADLAGVWAVASRQHPVNAEICNKHTDKRGLPRTPCRFNADLLHLNKRAYAWLEFHDERIEGKFYCVPESIPSLLVRDFPVRIEQRAGRVLMEYQKSIHNNVSRTVYTDGRSHLDAGDTPLYYGYSIGKYDGDEFVVDTRNFTFDPNGIDYMTNVPSSWRKRVVERYRRLAPDRLRLTLTIEEPEFMTQPYTESIEMIRVDYEIGWTHCEVQNAAEDLNMLPPKYED